jgi:hypothetical protein
MHPTFYRFAPLSTTALRTVVCALEGLVIVQFWLASHAARTVLWRALVAASLTLHHATPALHGAAAVWLLMTGVIAAAFGVLLGLRVLLPVADIADTTDADVARLLADFTDADTVTVGQEP